LPEYSSTSAESPGERKTGLQRETLRRAIFMRCLEETGDAVAQAARSDAAKVPPTVDLTKTDRIAGNSSYQGAV
jgi:hypothetical protein